MTIAALLKQKPYNVVVVRPRDRLALVVSGLAERRLGVALVMEVDNRLVGVISERDVMRALAAHGPSVLETEVERLMVRSVQTCSPRTTIDHAAAMMSEGRFRHLPVVENGRLVGLVSIRDLLNSKVGQQATDVHSLRGYVTGAYAARA